jgi:hypothetical protein
LEQPHVAEAMFGQETLHFEVSADPAHDLGIPVMADRHSI